MVVSPYSFYSFLSICVATFVAVPHNLPSAYMAFCFVGNVIQIRADLLYALHAASNEQTTLHADGRLMVSTEQVVLFTQCDWSDGIFSARLLSIWIRPSCRYPHHVLPSDIGVGYRLPGQAVWAVFYPFCFHP